MGLEITNVKHIYSGKVRELYALDDQYLAIVTTDRISAYDIVLDSQIPGKGIILNQLSIFWTKIFDEITPTHLVSLNNENITKILAQIGDPNWLKNRTMIVKKLNMIPLECIVRGYIAGSAWHEYSINGKLKGYSLPKNLQFADKLPEPIFTPSTKNKKGHDQNITLEEARILVGDSIDEISKISLELYLKASTYAKTKGIIIADTKFEFGVIDSQITLADEVITPDSSRFWHSQSWNPGDDQFSFDKQMVRDWLDKSGWDHKLPAPKLPCELTQLVYTRYLKACNAITKSCSLIKE